MLEFCRAVGGDLIKLGKFGVQKQIFGSFRQAASRCSHLNTV
jgi:hypothetical protein